MINNEMLALIMKFIEKPKFIFGLLLSFLGTALSLLLPQAIGQLLDEQFLRDLLNRPAILVGFVSLCLSAYTLQAISTYLIGLCGSVTLNRLQKHIYSSLLRSTIKELDRHQAGDFSSRLTNDMSIVMNFITAVLPNTLLNAIVILGSIYFLVRISLPMTLIGLLLVPILLFIILPINTKLEAYYTDYQEGLGAVSSRISHKFRNIRLMKAFNGENFEERVMGRAFSELTKNVQKIIGLSSVQSTLINSFTMFFIMFLFFIAGMEVTRGSMTMSTLMTFMLYMVQLIEPVTSLSESMTEWAELKSVSHRLTEILALDKEEHQSSIKTAKDYSITMKNVDFAYDDTEKVLNNVSLTVKSGQHLAIVGPSGAGKTTIFSLLMKFHQGYQGQLHIGNHCLSNLSPSQVRNLISYIPQDNTLFQGTIRENLFYGKNESVSEERLEEVLRELDLMQVIENLDNGLDTEITDSGIGLSEGQKQRFNIARALLQEHSIYLMDEVISSLDSVTEKVISQAINNITTGKTRLTIAHRLHTVQAADAILVLDKNGRISACGPHQQLMQTNELYREFLSGLPKAG